MILRHRLLLVPLLAALAACGSSGDDETLAPKETGKAQQTKDKIIVADGEQIGTPMAERVATLGLLNKRNGQTRDIELKPGEAIRFDKVVVRLRACEKTAPWETYPDEGDINFVKAMMVYKEVGYPYMMMPDHVPQHPDDRGGDQAFAFAYGHIRALIQMAQQS